MSISPELQLKRISSLHRLKFGGPNNFTVSGNPISVSFPFLCHLAQIFFVNIFEQNFMLTKRITVLGDLSMAYFSIRFMKLNVYLPKTSSSSLFFTLHGKPLATTLFRWLYWSISFQVIW